MLHMLIARIPIRNVRKLKFVDADRIIQDAVSDQGVHIYLALVVYKNVCPESAIILPLICHLISIQSHDLGLFYLHIYYEQQCEER